MVQRLLIRIEVGPAVPLEVVSQLIQSVNTVCNVALQLDRQSELNRATRLLPLDEPARIELFEYLNQRAYRPFDGSSDDDKLYRTSGRIARILERLLLSGVSVGPPNLWPPAEAQAAYLLEALPDSGPLVPTVEQISYQNPLEIVLTGFTWGHVIASGLTGGSLFALLNFAAYVGPKRKKLQAEAEKTQAEASKIEAEAGKTEAEADKLDAEAHQIRTDTELKAELYRALLRRVRDGAAALTPQQIDAIVDDRAIGAILELTQRPLEVEDQSDDEAG